MSSGCFEGDLTLHSHLRMTGSWGVYGPGRALAALARRAWLVLERAGHQVVQFDGPVLELLTESRIRFDQRLAGLGPDVLAAEFDADRFLARLRGDDQTRGIGDALLDQRNVAGIGNIWKAEGCWEAAVDPWRPVSEVDRRRGGCHHRRRASADVRIGSERPGAGGPAGVPAPWAAVSALRRQDPRPWAGRRQPHDLLVSGVSAVSDGTAVRG